MKILAERDDLIKRISKIEGKEVQYRHEVKNREVQIKKLED